MTTAQPLVEAAPESHDSAPDFEALWNHDYKPRAAQVKVLRWLTLHGSRINVVEAPTGVGKSPLCTTIANDGGGIILTPQITLQEQYLRDFPDIALIKSSANYQCGRLARDKERRSAGKPIDCKTGGSGSHVDCKSCPYRAAKQEFMRSRVSTANYAYFFRFVRSMTDEALDQMKHRWIILDEAHCLESSLIDSATVEITAELCKKMGLEHSESPSIRHFIVWFASLYEKATDKASKVAAELAMESDSEKKGRHIEELEERLKTLEDFLASASFSYDRIVSKTEGSKSLLEMAIAGKVTAEMAADEGIIPTLPDPEDRVRKWTLKPLYARHVWETLPERITSRKFFLTSATIPDFDYFINLFGWDKDEVSTFRIDSPFDPENRKVYLRGKVSLNRANIDSTLPDVIAQADKFIDQFSEDKGIIHAHTFKIVERIRELSRNRRRMIFHTGDVNREEVLSKFLLSTEPVIIVSPSMTEGVDLKGDLGRFAIFMKVPYPSMGDPWVKARMDRDPDWFNIQVAKTIIQGTGRVCRSKKDWGVTIMLDGGFSSFMKRHANLFPEWYFDAVYE